ncbi:MAG TPA: T9SS type A sorting domain-containing protein [Flavobacteriales bacterium]|nr:T9SS type A sorting domain-containing protein [Flavobacteriales bacterium]
MMRIVRASISILSVIAATLANAQCPGSTVVLYSSDFESNDGGLVEGGFGDWEYGDIPTMLLDVNCTSTHVDPIGAHSGTKGWGTILTDCYSNSGDTSVVAVTVDLSEPSLTTAELQFYSWLQIFTEFDYVFIKVNGQQVYLNNSVPLVDVWTAQTLDLTPYIGQASVTISFHLFATAVINKAGWYLDDISVTACSSSTTIGIAENETPALAIWPNPASGSLFVRPNASAQGKSNWVLFDATGRTVLQGAFNSTSGANQIPVQSLRGMHILEWRTGTTVVRERVLFE